MAAVPVPFSLNPRRKNQIVLMFCVRLRDLPGAHAREDLFSQARFFRAFPAARVEGQTGKKGGEVVAPKRGSASILN